MRRSRSDLIQRMLDGDRSSFDDIVTWYSDDVMRLCYSLLWSEEDAKDVLQETMLRLVEMVKEQRFRVSNGSVKGFLLSTARNLCIDRLRKRVDFRSYDELEPTFSTSSESQPRPDRFAHESEVRFAFNRAVAELTEPQRTILILRDINGESLGDIAQSLGIRVNCVKVHLHHARKRMRKHLAPFMDRS